MKSPWELSSPGALRPSLPPAGAAAFRARFLGIDERVDRLLLTPIGAVFSRLSGEGRGPGLWPSGLIGDVPVVQGPQGRAIADAIFNLPAGCQLVFVGLAGGLRPPATRGKWVAVGRACSGGRAYEHTLAPPPEFDIVTGATVGSLTESWAATTALAKQADVVDLETGHVYEVAHACGIRVVSLLLVTDEPPRAPFWETDLHSLDDQVAALMEAIGPWLTGAQPSPALPTATAAQKGGSTDAHR